MNGNKESILGTIIHELLHVVMSYHIDLAKDEIITEAELSAILPVYSACNNNPTASFNTCSHEEMAANYVDLMAQTIQNYNTSLTEYEALGIAWIGLYGTSYWSDSLSQDVKDNIYSAGYNIENFPETTNATPCE